MTYIILGAFVGFVILAFLLLFPLYRFLKKEEAKNSQEPMDRLVDRDK